ncbi:selenocysteine lyase/cysteine desulfurase [Filimonas zeae]|uniref:Aminotransferase class V n=1 Tax=Filimonas zeae TaxID=1737353 RepID=A0A917J056_9BACT|nr:aminotransferase class V-fold PLP-dependent enzyme [Filimonas zeae]MDR6338757.1 selenocysteine lyase/cysteine desulfurase [Filimonas zeae]GGH66732.1 aminotransferase class V [Filimonas zeae]
MITPLLTEEDIEALRNETPGTAHVIHFNNAGCSLAPTPVVNTITAYLQQEALLGGYEAEAQYEQQLNNTYNVIARLINAQPEEITLVENASNGWCIAFHGIGLQPGDEVLISEFEYVTNMIGYLYGKQHYGITLTVIPNDEQGNFSITKLKEAITDKTRLIAVTHIASATGGVLPVEAIGAIAAEHHILYLLDACQSIGQLPVDVAQIQCDFLSVTGRKYLRAPRGTGFLYVSKKSQHKITPLFLDGHAVSTINEQSYQLLPNGKRFEFYEKNRATTLGLAKAVEYALHIGMDRIWNRIQYLATHLRNQLQLIEQVTLQDGGNIQCGIITFTVNHCDSKEVKEYLALHHINVSVGLARSTLLHMNKHQLNSVVRASVHYYNTLSETDFFIKTLSAFVQERKTSQAHPHSLK